MQDAVKDLRVLREEKRERVCVCVCENMGGEVKVGLIFTY